ncbi:cytochrome-c peroxidase [Lysobacter enzymogenes]|nr:cytochrome-c peroxidase [Lysobacter enzymogenes]
MAPGADSADSADNADLDACRRRLDAGGAQIDRDCLRRVYALPIEQWPRPLTDPGARWSELAPLPRQAPHPPGHPPDPAKVALGKRLFEDPRLSGSGQIACANCHDSELGWGDGRSVPFGHDRQRGRRNAPSVAMSGFAAHLFWDGRASTLEEQVLHPLTDPREMAARPAAVLRALRRDESYRRQYAQAFGSPGIDLARTAQALAGFQRSLVPRFNRFDRFLEGNRGALDDRELWGLHLFRTRARCMNCHSGATLSDDGFHNLGLHFYGRKLQDLGRYEVTGDPADSGKFKTPSLRNVAKTGPWMHNGRFATLRGVVNLYNAGMPRPQPSPQQIGDPLFPQPDPLLHRLDLHRTELEAITAFLETL